MKQPAVFKNRFDAGQQLGARLRRIRAGSDATVVLGLTCGGVPVGAGMASVLGVPFDIIVVETLCTANGETIGAVTSSSLEMDTRVFGLGGAEEQRVTRGQFDVIRTRALRHVMMRSQLYRPLRPNLDLSGLTVIIADDAMLTGARMRAAIDAVRLQGVKSVIVATPVGTDLARRRMRHAVQGLVCISIPLGPLDAPSFYNDFSPVTDDQVMRILSESTAREVSSVSHDLQEQ